MPNIPAGHNANTGLDMTRMLAAVLLCRAFVQGTCAGLPPFSECIDEEVVSRQDKTRDYICLPPRPWQNPPRGSVTHRGAERKFCTAPQRRSDERSPLQGRREGPRWTPQTDVKLSYVCPSLTATSTTCYRAGAPGKPRSVVQSVSRPEVLTARILGSCRLTLGPLSPRRSTVFQLLLRSIAGTIGPPQWLHHSHACQTASWSRLMSQAIGCWQLQPAQAPQLKPTPVKMFTREYSCRPEGDGPADRPAVPASGPSANPSAAV